ncbi:bifunctional riboflavin kinase/FMN adenylyltransferase [Neobacillus bataviensis LMG 21833]|uniref:FAD synthase n=1 Tax=Neobacillus bataviensis LMG 21833 TaxID=1117379 RepID=K6DB87_9BACI|nr:FAD synthetase family protein [Neobacillus bataviensis]EKN65338.1 bifunctional riboflavin kinase/FMN adenylyltransferase [Neobacillus bataviensis LMG 21833]
METIYLNPENLKYWQQKAKQSVMALGFFDGIHNGHRKVIQIALQKAREQNLLLTVMSFFPHPKTVLSNGKTKVDYLMPLPDKQKLFSDLGVDIFYIVEFDREFTSLLPEKFVAKYLLDLGVIHAVAGFDYSYGFRGEGNMDRLKADSMGILEVTKVNKVECNGEKISSTCIREKLAKGNVEDLPAFLGRSYEVGCEWDGSCLTARPYYTIPASGRYAVTLTGESYSQEMDVIVTSEKEIIPLLSISELFLNGNTTVSVTWHQRIREEVKDSFTGQNWLHSTKYSFVWSGS